RAFAYLQSGALGKVKLVRGFNYKYRSSIGKTPGKGHIPETLDYDLWCGPARKGPIDRAEVHYDWHWVWDTGGGELSNNAPHQLDQIRWALGESGLPRRAMGFGGRFGYDDAGEVPNTFTVFYDYASAPVIFEIRGLPDKPGSQNMDAYRAVTSRGRQIQNVWAGGKANTGVLFECEDGYLDIAAGSAFDYSGKLIRKFDSAGSSDPQTSFIRAVRSRKREDIKTDIEQGHLSACLSHMGNISYRLGAGKRPEEIRESLQSDTVGLEAFGRFREHLALHGVDLDAKPAVMGPWVEMDSAAERFTGPHAAGANALVKRQYRRPYVVPEKV
ncbi:MAG: gfo/Idh/MocA family oxidoreductase, partial [Acidobacteria bacterium]|nr:gfo/Idh/MocA family oxidoreductase [Acidobacteriota bacterium]